MRAHRPDLLSGRLPRQPRRRGAPTGGPKPSNEPIACYPRYCVHLDRRMQMLRLPLDLCPPRRRRDGQERVDQRARVAQARLRAAEARRQRQRQARASEQRALGAHRPGLGFAREWTGDDARRAQFHCRARSSVRRAAAARPPKCRR
jgi:hypothetical protein